MRTIAFFSLLTLLLVGGCNQKLLISDPTARVVRVRVVSKTNEASAVRVTVELNNPNDVPLPLRRVHYTVDISGSESFSFKDQPARTLPASGRQTVELAAVFPGDPTGAACHVSGWVTYEPPGEVRKLLTDSGIPLPSADFSSTEKIEPQKEMEKKKSPES